MPPSLAELHQPSRHHLIGDLFGDGLPRDLAALLGLNERCWLMINVPVEMLASAPPRGLPDTIDVVGATLRPRNAGDMAEVERRARWFFPRPEQQQACHRMATDLALSRGLLRPTLESVFALHLHTPCDCAGPDALATGLLEVGFPRAVVPVGEDGPEGSGKEGAVIVRSRVDEVEERLRLVLAGEPVPVRPARAAIASKPLRGRLHQLLHGMHVPRKPPVVVDMSPTEH